MNMKYDNNWCGTIIAEAFESLNFLEPHMLVATYDQRLESEEERGRFVFHNIKISSSHINQFIREAKQCIKPGWYLHLVNDIGCLMFVVFHDVVFEFNKGDEGAFQKIKKHGLQEGIHEDQLQLERLFDKPYD